MGIIVTPTTKLNLPTIGAAMRLSTKRVAIGIVALLIPFIPAAKAYAIPEGPHFLAKADFVPIKMWAGWKVGPKEFACLDAIFTAESHWNAKAHNSQAVWMGGKKYHAGGIPQILGLSTKVNPYRQVNLGIRYINRRYGNSCKALAWHRWKGWY